MIEVSALSKSYRDRQAISAISFTAKPGEILGFLGPNGAGKSTTMKILAGVLAADGGSARVNGFDVREQSMAAKASIGYLPELPPVYLGMEVGEYLSFAAALRRVEKGKRAAAVSAALEACDLGSVRGRIIGHLSKGFRQRVGLAQAIVHRPPVLILDEPTVGLDPRQIIEIRNLVRGLAGQHTVILSTHILSEVKATCDRVVVIDRGRVVAEDTLEGISARVAGNNHISLRVRQNPEAQLEKLRAVSGVLGAVVTRDEGEGYLLRVDCQGASDPRAVIAELVVAAGLGLLELGLVRASLEEAFVKLVSADTPELTHGS